MKSNYSNFWLKFAKIFSYRFASTTSIILLYFSPLILNITAASAQTSENGIQQTGIVSIRDIVSTLIQILRSKDTEARVNAARALGGMGIQAKIAEPALMVALNDNESKVRYTAATALANIGGDTKSALPLLQEALQNESKWIRNDAASALSNFALNIQTQSRSLKTKELNQVIKDLEKTLEVIRKSDYKISPQVVKSINNSLESLKRERLRG
ncbi:MAG: HEAT repeat domain-containing protein [Rivularia sp. (in: Bacteria)]|nr:HEAT repeat domain-containing protein [Rivularia sp. MS3]